MQGSLIRITIIALVALGLWGVGGISFTHWAGERPCPTIGLIPACYIIFVGYGLVLLSMYPNLKKSLEVFLIGWIPVITLALVGVIGEITSTLHCPLSEVGIPKCYFSAALSLFIGLLYWRFYKVQLSK
ncbi:MAG: hypothetical protein ACI85N_002002 [Gammaproteobacteria bacterium]|jgi:hypothetical protein